MSHAQTLSMNGVPAEMNLATCKAFMEGPAPSGPGTTENASIRAFQNILHTGLSRAF